MSRPNTTASECLFVLAALPSCILSISLSDMSTKLLVADCGQAPYGLAVDAELRRILWVSKAPSRSGRFIECVDIDGSNRVTTRHQGAAFTLPTQLAVDIESEHLYWSDRDGSQVVRSRFDGNDATVLFRTNAMDEQPAGQRRRCVGVALSRTENHIYWIQKERSARGIGRIVRAELEPPAAANAGSRSDPEVVLSDLPEPLCLTWDGVNGFIYWTDRGRWPSENTLNRARYVGGRFVDLEILLGGLREGTLIALDVCHGRAFLSDPSGSVRVMDVDRPGESRVIFSGSNPLSGIAYVSPLKGSNPQSDLQRSHLY